MAVEAIDQRRDGARVPRRQPFDNGFELAQSTNRLGELRITLAWSDAVGTDTSQPLVSDLDLEVISYVLMAARDYLSMRFSLARGKVHAVPEEVVGAYMRLLKSGLFTSRKS